MPEVIHLHRAHVVEPEAAHAACDLPPHYGAGPDIGEDYEDAEPSESLAETVSWWWQALRWPAGLLAVLLGVHGWFSGWFA